MTGFERFRRKALLTQAELAELMKVTPQAVVKWESGKGNPTSSTLQKLSERLNVPMEDLIRKDWPDSGLEELKAKGA